MAGLEKMCGDCRWLGDNERCQCGESVMRGLSVALDSVCELWEASGSAGKTASDSKVLESGKHTGPLREKCGNCPSFKGLGPDGYGQCMAKGGGMMRDDDLCAMKSRRGSVLLEAEKTINGKRQDCYGSPEDSFAIIAEFWTTWLRNVLVGEISAHDVAMMMSLFKHARLMYGTDRDGYRDAAGYLGLACDMDNAKDREKD